MSKHDKEKSVKFKRKIKSVFDEFIKNDDKDKIKDIKSIIKNNNLPFLDYDYILRNTPNYEKLRVYLKNTNKGLSLFAREPIKKNHTISYYKLKVIKEKSSHEPVKSGIYTFNIYKKDNKKSRKYYGDICIESLDKPRRGIPYFGYFANEPSGDQKCNSYIDIDMKENYKERYEVKEGDFVTYRLVALNDISKDDEICWYYGDHYNRDYEISDKTR